MSEQAYNDILDLDGTIEHGQDYSDPVISSADANIDGETKKSESSLIGSGNRGYGKLPETLAEFYAMLADQNSLNSDISRLLLQLICWNNSVFTYDPFSDQPLTTDLDSYTKRLKDYEDHLNEQPIKDHVFHLVEFIIGEIKYLLNEIRQNIYRSHETMPLHMVRETDGKSLQILARRPGRTIKEKLSGNPVMVAVKRRFTFDTLENRLLKIFLKKLDHILLLRKSSFAAASLPYDDLATDLITKISYWKTSEAAEEIGMWKNNPPNNVLLQDRRYRKIWLGWQRIRSFDDMIRRDFHLMPFFVTDYMFWEIASFLNSFDNCRLFQKPLSRSNKKSPDDFDGKQRYTFFIEVGDRYYKIRGELQNNSLSFYVDTKLCGGLIAESDIMYSQIEEETFSQDLGSTDLRSYAHDFILKIIAGQGISEDQLVPRRESKKINSVMPLLAMDLTRTYPRYFDGVSEHECSFRPMVQFWTDFDKNESRISCEYSRGIFLSHQAFDIKSYTFRTIFNPEGVTSENNQYKINEAARELGDLFYRNLPAHKLVYAIPDLLDDFDLEPVRVGLGGAYGAAASIPASIAAVLSAHIRQVINTCVPEDLIVVLDSCNEGISMTPVLCNFDAKLKKQLPESGGIQFTRYPTSCVTSQMILQGNPVCENSDVEHELKMLFDDDGINRNANKTSFMIFDGESHYEHLNTHGKASQRAIRVLKMEQFEKFVKDCGFIKYKAIKVISLSDQVNINEIKSQYPVVSAFDIKADGAFLSSVCEAKISSDLVLWFDYLPNLSMEAMVKGKRKLWQLVRNKRVRPRLNEPVSIPIAESFILPAGKRFFHFPLVKGVANEKTRYEAYIESEQLPLKTELQCKLHLTYTYGAENPFNLVFIPVNNNSVEELQVQWKFKDDIPVDLTAFPIPSFPQRKSLESLMHYKSSKNNSESNLIIEFSKLLEMILSSKKCKKHILGDRLGNPRFKRDFAFYSVSTDYGDLEYFIHNDNYKKEKFILQSTDPAYLFEYVSNGKRKQRFFNSNSIKGRVIFLTANIFNLGWNVSDFQPEVRECFERFLHYVQNEINDPNGVDSSIMKIYIMIISFACNSIPGSIIEYINAKINIHNASPVICRIFGRLLHKCDEQWQQNILNRFLSILDKSYEKNKATAELGDDAVKLDGSVEPVLVVFARAIWHDESFALLFSYDNVRKILFHIMIAFNNNLIKLNKLMSSNDGNKQIKSDSRMIIERCTAYLELVLGLIRTRLGSDDNIKLLMLPDSEFNKIFLKLLDNFSRSVKKSKLNIRCFLEINLDSSKFKTNNPPIIEAVKHYLTSEDDSDAIRIVGIASEDDNADGEMN